MCRQMQTHRGFFCVDQVGYILQTFQGFVRAFQIELKMDKTLRHKFYTQSDINQGFVRAFKIELNKLYCVGYNSDVCQGSKIDKTVGRL